MNGNKKGSCDEHININILCFFFDLLKPVLLSQAGVKPITNIDDVDNDSGDIQLDKNDSNNSCGENCPNIILFME